MPSPRETYRLLLFLYPGSFRKAFGDEMLQTFCDFHDDTVRAGGRADAGFWGALLGDTISGAARQHADRWRAAPGAPVLALLLFPAVYAALVRVALALPHPPVHGVGFPIVFLGLLVGAAGLSAAGARTAVRLRRA